MTIRPTMIATSAASIDSTRQTWSRVGEYSVTWLAAMISHFRIVLAGVCYSCE